MCRSGPIARVQIIVDGRVGQRSTRARLLAWFTGTWRAGDDNHLARSRQS